MTREEQRRYDMFRRVQEFGSAHGQKFAKTSVGGKAFAAVGAAVAAIDRFSTAGVRTDDDGARAKAVARRAIVDQLQEIARTARLAGRNLPEGATTTFKVPKWRADGELIMAARAVVRDGRAAAAVLAPLGLPGGFVAELDALVTQFVEADRGRQAGRVGLAAARAGVAAAMNRASGAVQALDVIVANTFRAEPTVLAEWKRARRWRQPHAVAADVPPVPDPAPPAPVVVVPTPASGDTGSAGPLRKVS